MRNDVELTDADSPFHPGERTVQERLGVRERTEVNGRRMVRDFMPQQHREFFPLLPFVVVGSLDAQGRPWASLLSGSPGFVASPHPRSLVIRSAPLPGDPLENNLHVGAPLGLLGIELETRRRNRANGRVLWRDTLGFELSVEQSFGNCKQYIQARTRLPARHQPVVGAMSLSEMHFGGAQLGERAAQILSACDTAFLATASAAAAQGRSQEGAHGSAQERAEGVDVSHRGGPVGFLRVEQGLSGTRITLPDYAGNNMFNSLGNIEVRPLAGLLACDFVTGDLLSLTGGARVLWDRPALGSLPGALRLLEIDVEQHVLLPSGLADAWSTPEFAPQFAP